MSYVVANYLNYHFTINRFISLDRECSDNFILFLVFRRERNKGTETINLN